MVDVRIFLLLLNFGEKEKIRQMPPRQALNETIAIL
jgi:hypothetical protein